MKHEDVSEGEESDSSPSKPSTSSTRLPADFSTKWSYYQGSGDRLLRSRVDKKDDSSPSSSTKKLETQGQRPLISSSFSSSKKRPSSSLSSTPFPDSSEKVKKQRKGYSDPAVYSHLKGLPDILAKDLDSQYARLEDSDDEDSSQPSFPELAFPSKS